MIHILDSGTSCSKAYFQNLPRSQRLVVLVWAYLLPKVLLKRMAGAYGLKMTPMEGVLRLVSVFELLTNRTRTTTLRVKHQSETKEYQDPELRGTFGLAEIP